MPGGWAGHRGRRIGRAAVIAVGMLACGPSNLAAEPSPPRLATAGNTATETRVSKSSEQPAKASTAVSEATAVEVVGDRASTLFQLTLSRGVTAEVYTLANPYRVIIDLPDLAFRLPGEAGRTGRGLIAAFRYGQFAEGKARIVMDTEGPVAIGNAAMAVGRDGTGVVLTVELKPADPAAFGGGTGAARLAETAPPPSAPAEEAAIAKRQGRSKPVIMLDPGHGGIDPGAVGFGNLLEKDLVLTVARKVRAKLAARGRYDVVMTRSTDVFVPLGKRLEMSRQHASDLFLSIHADSIDEAAFAQSIKGATVYTLSERASDAEARAMAEKENASDLIAGLDVDGSEESNQVKSILIDLMKRETANFSTEFSRTLVRKMRSSVSLSRDPERAAAFKVLKQTHAPSVLVELGYVSNAEEASLMQSAPWQDKIVASITAAIEAYFEKRTVGGP